MLKEFLIKRAVEIAHESYGSVMPEHAFLMALGEAEVEFDTDIDMKFTDEIAKTMEYKLKQKG